MAEIQINMPCVVPHKEEVWTTGKIIKIEGDKCTIQLNEGGNLDVSKKEVVPISEKSMRDADDMTTLEDLHPGIILYNLKQRFLRDSIYTYIGPMVVSINPFKSIEKYGPSSIPEYLVKEKEDLMPHLYAIAQKAYKSMRDFGESQSVIISGESGAGKTEATKIVLNFLTEVSTRTQGEGEFDLASMILATNPILEAFGNAKTTRNNNSSRFGKFIKIEFDGTKICGATIDNYLLEKTRVIYQAPTERNYHIFYQIVIGTTAELKQKYKIRDSPNDYRYLTNGNIEAPGCPDEKWWKKTSKSFQILGFTEEEVDTILRTLSSVLLIGNIEFKGETEVSIVNEDVVDNLCELLGVAKGPTRLSLTERQFTAGNRNTAYTVPLNMEQAKENRDTLAKDLYAGLFNWLVVKLNQNLKAKSTASEKTKFIGVLDIYGFEIFQKNSLEQFCINYANEKLHQQFINFMFKSEQKEYEKEGISWKEIDIKDNQDCILLIEKQGAGIISLLAEEGKVPKGSDTGFSQRVRKQHGRSRYFAYKAQEQDSFGINHFAGTVMYDVNGFLDKNKDQINQDLVTAMKTSNNTLVKGFFNTDEDKKEAEKVEAPPPVEDPKKKPTRQKRERERGGKAAAGKGGAAGKAEADPNKRVSVTEKFKQDLQNLVDTLSVSEPHYVRCIKPNDEKQKLKWDAQKIYGQLACNGIWETVALRKAGYSKRMPFDTWIARFFVCLGSHPRDPNGIKSFFEEFMPGSTDWAIGHSKVFFKRECC